MASLKKSMRSRLQRKSYRLQRNHQSNIDGYSRGLEEVLHREMREHNIEMRSFKKLWQFYNSKKSKYIPFKHFLIVTDIHNVQYLFRENKEGTEIFGCELPSLKRINVELMRHLR